MCMLDHYSFRLATNGKFERAAAIAVFHHDIPSAINILTTGASERLNNSQQGMHDHHELTCSPLIFQEYFHYQIYS